jgi:hypothetical protein
MELAKALQPSGVTNLISGTSGTGRHGKRNASHSSLKLCAKCEVWVREEHFNRVHPKKQ